MPLLQKILRLFCLWALFFFLVYGPEKSYSAGTVSHSAEALAHYTMGVICDLYESPEDAITEYKRALEYESASYLIHFKLASDYARLGAYAQATVELKTAIQLNPKDLQAHYLLALIYSTQKKYDLASEEYEHILKSLSQSEPGNPEIFGYLGQLYYSQKKYSKAIEQFEKILQLEPQNAEVMFLLGSLHLEIKQKLKAVDFFTKSIAIDPQHDGSLNSLGYLYSEDAARLDEALDLVKQAVTINPNNGAYLDSLGWVYYQKGMYAEALESLKKADTIIKDAIIYDHLGDVYYKLNDINQAEKYWKLSVELRPAQAAVVEKLKQLNKNMAVGSTMTR